MLYGGGAMGASISFRALCKNCYKIQMCNSISLIVGTNGEHVNGGFMYHICCESEEYSRSYEHLFT